MAHFAELDANSRVLRVIVVANAECQDENGVEREEIGVAFCQSLFGGNWKQTSYSGSMRKNYAGVGSRYDETRDAFIPEQPFPSWVLDEATCRWEAPAPFPDDGKLYQWDEGSLGWVEIGA